jgi:hypothetical protein
MAAFVLGNGVSRESVDIEKLKRRGSVYGCNGLYRTHTVTALIATDQPISLVIQDSGYSKHNRFYTRRPMPNTGAQTVPKEYFGFSSGPIATAIAAKDRENPVYIIGFDMGPNQHGQFNNVYAGTQYYKPMGAAPTYTGNWTKQLIKIISDHPDQQFVRVMGATTATIPDFANVKNLTNMAMDTFLERINTGKDL